MFCLVLTFIVWQIWLTAVVCIWSNY